MTLSPTQTQVLTAAAHHPHHLAKAPVGLPAAARNAVFRSMLGNELLAEVAAQPEHVGLAWRRNENGTPMVAHITDVGLRVVGVDPAENDRPAGAPYSPPDALRPSRITHTPQTAQSAPQACCATLHGAAASVVAAWDTEGHGSTDLAAAIERLRSLLAAKHTRRPGHPRTPRQGTKQATVLALLRRSEGAGGPQLQEATGWAPHTMRGFLAGLGRKGVAVTVLERVRQVGPGKAGAASSYSIYRAADAG